MNNRWWIYQKERFPLVKHGILILAFSFCAVSFSSHLRAGEWPQWQSAVSDFIACFIFFLQLRIADEFKDFEEDSAYRPYRPVPRGLVTLRELGWVFGAGALIQLGAAILWCPKLIVVLLIAWLYLAGMSFEFGVRAWLKKHPITYLWTHMLIMPIVDFYATASDWMPAEAFPHKGLAFFLMASFFNGIVIEIGRKIRVPEQEEKGVETYTVLWGIGRATAAWWLVMLITTVFAILASIPLGAHYWITGILGTGVLATGLFLLKFNKERKPNQAKAIETIAGVWTIVLYASLGIIPGVLS